MIIQKIKQCNLSTEKQLSLEEVSKGSHLVGCRTGWLSLTAGPPGPGPPHFATAAAGGFCGFIAGPQAELGRAGCPRPAVGSQPLALQAVGGSLRGGDRVGGPRPGRDGGWAVTLGPGKGTQLRPGPPTCGGFGRHCPRFLLHTQPSVGKVPSQQAVCLGVRAPCVLGAVPGRGHCRSAFFLPSGLQTRFPGTSGLRKGFYVYMSCEHRSWSRKPLV